MNVKRWWYHRCKRVQKVAASEPFGTWLEAVWNQTAHHQIHIVYRTKWRLCILGRIQQTLNWWKRPLWSIRKNTELPLSNGYLISGISKFKSMQTRHPSRSPLLFNLGTPSRGFIPWRMYGRLFDYSGFLPFFNLVVHNGVQCESNTILAFADRFAPLNVNAYFWFW